MRVALGARSGQILVLVLRQSVKLAFVGIIAGIAVSFFAARIIDSLLPGTGWSLPTTIGGGVVVLLVVTLASYIPVRQALRLDAAQVLRA
jgi:ABC-type antimicrobial peptide transport system permease subunit